MQSILAVTLPCVLSGELRQAFIFVPGVFCVVDLLGLSVCLRLRSSVDLAKLETHTRASTLSFQHIGITGVSRQAWCDNVPRKPDSVAHICIGLAEVGEF